MPSAATTEREPSASAVAPRRSCTATLVALVLLVASLGLEAWNLYARTPWAPVRQRSADATPHLAPFAQVNPYGVNTFLADDVEHWKREKTMEMIAAAGIGWIKQGFLWSEIEPARGSHWDEKYQQDAWKKYDEIVALAERYGVRIIARLDHTPAWARPPDTTPHTPPSDPEDFARFVGTFVKRYRGRVQYIQIWNEPNLAKEWGGRVDPAGYARLLRAAYRSAKAADPNVVVLSAPMAMTNERSDRAMPELDYWRALYALGAGEYFDVMCASAYGLDQPPTAPPDPATINVRRIELLRQLMVEAGDGDKAMWLNEYGWNAAPATIPADELVWRRVSEEEQARWTPEGIAWMREHLPWVGVVSIWYFRQIGTVPPSDPIYYFRLVDVEFTPRPVYLTVQRDAIARQLALPGRYGEMEAPVVALGTWPRVSDPRAVDGQYIRSAQAGAAIELRFLGSDVTLLLPPSTPRGRLYVELDGRPASGPHISRDESGRAYIDLSALPVGTREVPVVRGLGSDRPQAEHRLRLTLGPGSELALDGIVVDYRRTYTQFGAYALAGLVGVVGAVRLLRRRA